MASRAYVHRPMFVASSERRDETRHRVIVTRATIRAVSDEPEEALLNDLSIYGCRLESKAGHAPDDRVWLRLNGSMPIGARIVWSRDGMIGCRFDTPIARGLLRSLTLSVV